MWTRGPKTWLSPGVLGERWDTAPPSPQHSGVSLAEGPKTTRRQQRSAAALQGQEGRCWAQGPWASDRDLLGSASPATRWTQPDVPSRPA